jgi:hypothetical protein
MHMNMKRHMDELLKTHMGTYERNKTSVSFTIILTFSSIFPSETLIKI